MRVSFASRLRNNERLIGTLLSLNSAVLAEIMAKVGFDWLFIDAEHGAFSPQDTQAHAAISRQLPLRDSHSLAGGNLDQKIPEYGPQPVSSCRRLIMPPMQKISCAGPSMLLTEHAVWVSAAHTAMAWSFEDYLKHANDSTAVILQAETPEAIENIDGITDVKGIDAILIGPYDLSIAMGKPGQLDDPLVVEASETIRKCCQSKGIALGYFGITAEAVRPYMEKGFNLITIGCGYFISVAWRQKHVKRLTRRINAEDRLNMMLLTRCIVALMTLFCVSASAVTHCQKKYSRYWTNINYHMIP